MKQCTDCPPDMRKQCRLSFKDGIPPCGRRTAAQEIEEAATRGGVNAGVNLQHGQLAIALMEKLSKIYLENTHSFQVQAFESAKIVLEWSSATSKR